MYRAAFEELPPRALFTLKGDRDRAARWAGCLGVALPDRPNTVARAGELALAWIGPSEYLAQAPDVRQEELARTLEAAAAETFAAVVTLSDYYRILRLDGADAAAVLAQGTALDLHQRAFPTAGCSRTGLAQAVVILERCDPASRFELLVERSYADYLRRWLETAIGA